MLCVVSGPPGTGKSNCIRSHAKAAEILIDMDLTPWHH